MAKGSQEGNTAGKGLHDARSTSNTGGAHRPVAPKESGAGKQADNTKRIGELSWVRIKGYPWWPCLRVLLEDVPAHLREEVLNARKPLAQLAFCFGDHLFIWAQREELQPWATNKNSLIQKGGKGKLFLQALREAEAEADEPGPLHDKVNKFFGQPGHAAKLQKGQVPESEGKKDAEVAETPTKKNDRDEVDQQTRKRKTSDSDTTDAAAGAGKPLAGKVITGPKVPRNGFELFCALNKAKVLNANPSCKPLEAIVFLREIWGDLDDAKRLKFHRKATSALDEARSLHAEEQKA